MFPEATTPAQPNAQKACSLASLGRTLLARFGAHAPTDVTIRAWAAQGRFESCKAPREAIYAPKQGKRGQLYIEDSAIARVCEIWPQLLDLTTPSPPMRGSERPDPGDSTQLLAMIRAAIGEQMTSFSASTKLPGEVQSMLSKVHEQNLGILELMRQIQRDFAQFNSQRNNMLLKMDEAITLMREAKGSATSGGFDPLVEARRDRDMGHIKSSLERLLANSGE